jgi:hypothetical protein
VEEEGYPYPEEIPEEIADWLDEEGQSNKYPLCRREESEIGLTEVDQAVPR